MIIWVSTGRSSEIQSPFLPRGHRYWLHLGGGGRGGRRRSVCTNYETGVRKRMYSLRAMFQSIKSWIYILNYVVESLSFNVYLWFMFIHLLTHSSTHPCIYYSLPICKEFEVVHLTDVSETVLLNSWLLLSLLRALTLTKRFESNSRKAMVVLFNPSIFGINYFSNTIWRKEFEN